MAMQVMRLLLARALLDAGCAGMPAVPDVGQDWSQKLSGGSADRIDVEAVFKAFGLAADWQHWIIAMQPGRDASHIDTLCKAAALLGSSSACACGVRSASTRGRTSFFALRRCGKAALVELLLTSAAD